MVRRDTYTEYNGREYRLVINRYTKEYKLVANLLREEFSGERYHNEVSRLLKQGFKQYSKDTYTKTIQKEKLKEVYYIKTYVKFKGYEFSAWMDKGDEIYFVTDDSRLAKELEFERFLDHANWIKHVKKNEVEIFEKKEIVDISRFER